MSVNNLIPPHYLNLSTHGKVKVEYVWISVTGQTLQSKTRTFDFEPKTLEGNIFRLFKNQYVLFRCTHMDLLL